MDKKIETRELEHMQPVKKFLFDPRKLNDIVKKTKGMKLDRAFEFIADELSKAYPGYISKNERWIFNNAGGAMGQLKLLHGSIREYIIFFGTCIGTEGHSGRYSSEVYDYMIRGEMECEYTGVFEPEIHRPGMDPAHLGKKMVKHYRIKNDAFMLEYCRGNVPKMFPFGILDSILSTIDVRSIGQLVFIYSKLMLKNLFLRGKDLPVVLKFSFFCGLCAIAFWLL